MVADKKVFFGALFEFHTAAVGSFLATGTTTANWSLLPQREELINRFKYELVVFPLY